MRVGVHNVHGLRAGVDRVAPALASLDADILLLQECGSARRLRRLADALGMGAASSHRPFGRVRNAVLFGPSWRLVGTEPFGLSRVARSTPRGALAASLRRTGLVVVAVAAHLGLSPAERVRHARELTDAYAGSHAPLLLGADLNEGPDGPAFRWIAERLFDAFAVAGEGPGDTFPADAPRARIDALFVSDRVRVIGARVGSAPGLSGASDHLPVVVDLELLTD